MFADLDHQSPEAVFFYFGIAAGVAGHAFLVGPELIWPPEQSWVVCTDYDLSSTYIGCDEALATRLSEDDLLEIVEVSLDSPVD